MADSPAQQITSTTYNRPQTAAVSTELENEIRARIDAATKKGTFEFYSTWNPANVAKKVTIVLTEDTIAANDTVAVEITDADSNVADYIYTVQTGDTMADIVSGFLAVANVDDDVVFTSSGSGPYTITAESAVPGRDITLTFSETGGSLTLGSPTTVNANSGTANHGKFGEVDVQLVLQNDDGEDGFFGVKVSVHWYDGDPDSPTELTTSGGIIVGENYHPTGIGAIQTAQGVAA
jgi:hypothetical protein